MKKKLGLFLIRGAGEEGFKQQEKFVERLREYLKLVEIDPDDIYVEYGNWYEPTQSKQEELLRRFLNSKHKLKAKWLRKIILYVASDVVAYTGEPTKKSDTYIKTHELIHNSILNIKKNVEENAPLIIIASSLATEIISNYIWDREHNADESVFGRSQFERLETLTGVFMLGNDTPIYVASHEIDNAMPFTFPPKKLPPKYKHIAQWINFFDKNDPLGYPMKPINEHYDKMVTEDVQINSGGLLMSWNLGSHFAYWKSKKLTRKIAGYIKSVINTMTS